MLTGLPGEAIESISGYARLWIVGLAKVLFGCRTILGEWSEASSHQDTSNDCLFPVCDIRLRYISLNLIFLALIGRIHPIFA